MNKVQSIPKWLANTLVVFLISFIGALIVVIPQHQPNFFLNLLAWFFIFGVITTIALLAQNFIDGYR